ncbi:MAG: ABC transporter ATP-binding protein/permease [Bacteroidales bacterium]|nr:ABC transporter ATP-binding protein/permease [Bacteroidales bacterium]
MKSLRILFQYLKPYKWLALKNILYNVLSAFFALFTFTLVIPFLQILFNRVEPAPDPGAFSFSAAWIKNYTSWLFSGSIEQYGPARTLVFVLFIFAFTSFMKNLLVFLANNCMAGIRSGTVRDVRRRLYDKVLRLPLSFFSEARKGDIMTRMSNDVQEIEISVVSSLSFMFRDPFTVLIFVTYLVINSPQLTLFAFLLLPISAWLVARISRTLKSSSFKGQQNLGRLLSVLEETLSGLRIIKGFNAEHKMSGQFEEANEKYTKIFRRVVRKAYLAHPVSEFLSTIVLLILIYYGGSLALKGTGNMSPDRLIAFVVVFSQIIHPAKAISQAWFNIQKGMASIDRINQVLEAEETITEKPDAIRLKEFSDNIEFRNVWFAYNSEPVLKDINLKIRKGQTVAIVGRSGGGKSTLADLIPRFMDPDRGAVLIDGIDIRDVAIKDLRHLMGIVSQQAILFNDTFSNNISFGVEAGDREGVMRAAEIANAHSFVISTEEGYESMVGEGGNKLSGGQRQRISIARHRLSTVQHADLIVVLEDGQIVEAGKHDELVSIGNGIYRKLYEMQSF